MAKHYRVVDPDDVLIVLWDYPLKKGYFDYIKNRNSVVKKKDLKLAKDIIKSLKNDSEYKNKNVFKKISTKKLDFSSIGKITSPLQHIKKEEVLKMYEELVSDFSSFEDPISPAGLKDEGLLEAALLHPQTAYLGKIKYPSIETAGACLMYALSHNHPFFNGNKRTAIVATLVFLDRHNICLTCNEDEVFKISLKVADHRMAGDGYIDSDAEIYELAKWMHENSKIMKKGERPISLRKLRQLLAKFNCEILPNGKVKRTRVKTFFSIPRNTILISKKQISSTLSEGDEVRHGLIKSIREDLELDSAHNIDSDSFYSEAEFSSSEFISKYKNLLRRLSRI